MPVYLDLEQGSPNWLKWKEKTIGASEISSLLGLNPWKSAYDLLLEKRNLKPKQTKNYRMQRGNDLEPYIRHCFELYMRVSIQDTQFCLIHDEFEYLSCSLDGYLEDENAVVEIKAPNIKVIQAALNNEIVDYYYCQLQQQMLVMNCEYAYFVCLNGAWITDPIKVRYSHSYQQLILDRSRVFNELILDSHLASQKEVDQYFSLPQELVNYSQEIVSY